MCRYNRKKKGPFCYLVFVIFFLYPLTKNTLCTHSALLICIKNSGQSVGYSKRITSGARVRALLIYFYFVKKIDHVQLPPVRFHVFNPPFHHLPVLSGTPRKKRQMCCLKDELTPTGYTPQKPPFPPFHQKTNPDFCEGFLNCSEDIFCVKKGGNFLPPPLPSPTLSPFLSFFCLFVIYFLLHGTISLPQRCYF